MSIEKESTGLPEIDLNRRTTKVNLTIIVAISAFVIAMGIVVAYFARRTPPEDRKPSSPIEQSTPATPAPKK